MQYVDNNIPIDRSMYLPPMAAASYTNLLCIAGAILWEKYFFIINNLYY